MSLEYDEVGVGKQVLSTVQYIFRKILGNRWTIQRLFFSSCSLDFKGQIYCLLGVDKFGLNIWGNNLSLLKSREFCHLFQQVISESTLPSGSGMCLDLHTNENSREINHFFSSPTAFINLFGPCSVH